MDGSSYARGIGSAIVALIIAAIVGGGLVFLGGYFLLSWLASHISFSWS